MCSLPHKIGCTHGCGIKNTPKTMHYERVYQRIQNHTTNEYVSVFIKLYLYKRTRYKILPIVKA